jgi:membrane-bound inhibitor of C-type lysozyme
MPIIIPILIVAAAAASAGMQASAANQAKKAQKNAAEDAQGKANDVRLQAEAEALKAKNMEAEAQSIAEKKMSDRRARLTEVQNTSPLGIQGQATTQKPTILGI